jgi:hypothetical protein
MGAQVRWSGVDYAVRPVPTASRLSSLMIFSPFPATPTGVSRHLPPTARKRLRQLERTLAR